MKIKHLLKKSLLLLALMGGATSAWAEDVFSYTVVKATQDNFSTTTDDSWNDYDATGGTFSLYYKNGKSSVARDGELYYYNFGGGDASIKLTLSSGTFQKGDVVTVSFKSNSGSKNASFKVRTAKKSSTNELTSAEVSGTQTSESVTLDDNFNDLSSIFIERTSQGMYAYSVTVTRPVTHSVSAVTSTGTDTYGTVSATSTTVAEGGTTTITAVPASGYKVTNWAVSGTGASISPSGASNSTSTTLTMGTADATVTVTFGAAGGLNVTHTLSNVTATSGATGEDAVSEGAEYTAVFAANSGYVLPEAITVTIGGETATAGTAYTWNKATGTVTVGSAYVTGNIVITVTGEEAYTLTYDANGGTGSMDATVSKGSITLTANAFTKSGYTFMGWATTADGDVAYADGAAYTLSADATLYAVWEVNDYSFAPTSSSGDIASGDVVATSTGGKMVYTPTGSSASLKYSTTSGTNCIEFGKGGDCQVTVTLDKVMKVGTVITLNYYTSSASARGFYLANSGGTNKATFSQSTIGTYTGSYTVVAGDGLAGSNVFIIKRNNNAYLNSVTVINCEQAVPATITSYGYASFSSTYALDFTNVTEATAYIATDKSGDNIKMQAITGTVAANTGLVLKSANGGAASFTIPVVAYGSYYNSDTNPINYLFSISSDYELGTTATGTNYVLSVQNINDVPTVVWAPIDDVEAPVKAGQAALWLPTDVASKARSLRMVFGDDITGINEAPQATDVAEKEGKFVINGQFVIFKGGKKYNAAGAQMK